MSVGPRVAALIAAVALDRLPRAISPKLAVIRRRNGRRNSHFALLITREKRKSSAQPGA